QLVVRAELQRIRHQAVQPARRQIDIVTTRSLVPVCMDDTGARRRDGLNTHDRWYTDGRSIDNAAGITLYTIQVNTGGDPTLTLLQNCAGSPGKYPDTNKVFLLTSATRWSARSSRS